MAIAVPLVLGGAGALLGSSFGFAGLGFAAGATLGGFLIRNRFGTTQKAPLPPELNVNDSTEGAFIPIVFGRARLGGNILALKSITTKQTKTKNGVKTVTYTRKVDTGISIGEGELDLISFIANGKVLIDLSANSIDNKAPAYTWHSGSAAQTFDITLEGMSTEPSPNYAGQAYIVFTGWKLNDYGNVFPNMLFEVERKNSFNVGYIFNFLLNRISTESDDTFLSSRLNSLFDISEISAIPCKGYVITEQTSFAQVISNLAIAYSFLDVETESRIRFRRLDVFPSSIPVITREDLVNSEILFSIKKDTDTYTEVQLNYIDEKTYEPAVARAVILPVPNTNVKTISLPVRMNYAEAFRAAWIHLYLENAKKYVYTFSLPANSGLRYEPGDLVRLNVSLENGHTYNDTILITKILLKNLEVEITGIRWEPHVLRSMIDNSIWDRVSSSAGSSEIPGPESPSSLSNLEFRWIDGPCFGNAGRYVRVFLTREGKAGTRSFGNLVVESQNYVIDDFLVKGRVTRISGIPTNIDPNMITRAEIQVEFGDEEILPFIAKNPGSLEFRFPNAGPFLTTGNSTEGYGFHLYEHASAITNTKIVFRNLLLFSNNSYDIVKFLTSAPPAIALSSEVFYISDIESDTTRIFLNSEGIVPYVFYPENSNVPVSGNMNVRFFSLVPPFVENLSISYVSTSVRSLRWNRKNRCHAQWSNHGDVPLDDLTEIYSVTIRNSAHVLEKTFLVSETSAVVSMTPTFDVSTFPVSLFNADFETGTTANWYVVQGNWLDAIDSTFFNEQPPIEGNYCGMVFPNSDNSFSVYIPLSSSSGSVHDVYVARMKVGLDSSYLDASAYVTLKGYWYENGVAYAVNVGERQKIRGAPSVWDAVYELSATLGPRSSRNEVELRITLSGYTTGVAEWTNTNILFDSLQVSAINTLSEGDRKFVEIFRETSNSVTTRMKVRKEVT